MNNLAPIVLFVYNRPWHTRKTLEALSKNILADQSTLYIYADGPKLNATEKQLNDIKELRTLIREKKWCKEVHIIEQKKNIGIGNSEIIGITEIVNNYGKIIVMEDDLVTSPGFLKYMNDALNLYENEELVFHISGYMFPVKKKLPETFFYNATSCWGWGTWVRAWKSMNANSIQLWEQLSNSERINEFTMNNLNHFDSLLYQNAILEKNQEANLETIRSKSGWNWDVCWHTSVFLKNGLCLHPKKSLVRNIGHDSTGLHCNNSWHSKKYSHQKIINAIKVEQIELKEFHYSRKAMEEYYFKLTKSPLIAKIKDKIKLIKKNINLQL